MPVRAVGKLGEPQLSSSLVIGIWNLRWKDRERQTRRWNRKIGRRIHRPETQLERYKLVTKTHEPTHRSKGCTERRRRQESDGDGC